jgi:adiponectin receptor
MSIVDLNYLDTIKDWYIVNPFVTGGYRKPRPPNEAFLSIFEWHNETLNIYSHLLPGLIWLYMLFSCVNNDYFIHSDLITQYIIRYAYFSASFVCLASSFAHTFNIVDRRWSYISWNLDFTGIIVINLSHQILDSFVLFKVINKSSQIFQISLLLELLFALYCINDIINEKKFWKILYPIISSTILTFPVVWYSFKSNNILLREVSLYSLECSLFIFIAGGFFFIGKIPERFWNPEGMFNNFNSHVWHHLFIVSSIIVAFRALPLLYLIVSN